MINLLCILIDHLAGVIYNEDSQTVNDLMANGRTCESLPGVITSYTHIFSFHNYSLGDGSLRYVFNNSPTLSTIYWRKLQRLSLKFIRTSPAERSAMT